MKSVDKHIYPFINGKGLVVLYGLHVIILYFFGSFEVSQSGFHMLSEKNNTGDISSTLAILFFDGVVDYLHDTR